MLKKLVLVLSILICSISLYCDKPKVSTPCDSYAANKLRVEYDFQEGYDLYDHDFSGGMYQAAFSEVGTQAMFCEDGSFTGTDTAYFDADGLFNEDRRDRFFQAHKRTDYPMEYYLAALKGSQQNKSRGANKWWGMTIKPSAPNNPPNPKWSFIFVGDVRSEPSYGKERTLTYTVIHELGHQRTGLTHPEDHPEYHFPKPNADCIMHSNYYITDAILNKMGFCEHSDEIADNCRYFLKLRNQ